MLVIVSDLHLTDGSTGETLSPGAFPIFFDHLRQLAVAASWRNDGQYRPIDRIDLVLLGDVLDLIRSTHWVQRAVRPWGDLSSSEFVEVVSAITGDVLRQNQESAAALRYLASEGIAVPPASSAGRPDVKAARQPVPARLHYMVGNHDWFFHVAGSAFRLLRRAVVNALGLAQGPEEPFPHEISENEELLRVMRRHKVTARHGDLFDPMCFEGDRDSSSLNDALVIELLNRFAVEIQARLADDLPPAAMAALHQIDTIRPVLMVPAWMEGVLERTGVRPAVRKRIKTTWDQLVDDLLSIDFIRRREAWNPADLVDSLDRLLKFSRRPASGWCESIVRWLHAVGGPQQESLAARALTEPDFRSRRSRHLVYGHTHLAETVPLDASYVDGCVLQQVYFNAGTWRTVHQPTRMASGEHEFIAHDVMTYLVFYQGDERKGRPYETWSGTLGYNPLEVPVHRIDSGNSAHAHGESLPTPVVHGPSPHFSGASRQAGPVPSRRL